MKGYAYRAVFSGMERAVYRHAVELVEMIPEPEEIDGVRCHELARALQRCLASYWQEPFVLVDGTAGCVQHSWIVTPEEWRLSRGMTILDPYSPGRLPMVQLVEEDVQMATLITTEKYKADRIACGLSPKRLGVMYEPGPERDDIDVQKVEELLVLMTCASRRLVYQKPNPTLA